MDTKPFIIIATCFVASILVGGEWTKLPFVKLEEAPVSVSTVSPIVVEKNTIAKANGVTSFQLPAYKPPKGIGPPWGRVGGSSRGELQLTLFALVPNHLGLTINAQPTLYWYISKPAPYPLVLTVNNEKQVKPIVETVLRMASKPGIHSVPLKALDITLELDTEYRWFVSMTVNPDSPSKDIVAGGIIKRIAPDTQLVQQLEKAKPEHLTAIYSEAGLWYDALASISNLCESSPKGNHYCIGRRELLEQIDLPFELMEIAKAEEDITVPQGLLH